METTQVIAFASILLLGIGAMWISWRLNLPSILILLVAGFLAGPITGWLDPDTLFGDMLFPLVSIAVAILLFEGGLNLKISDLGGARGVVRNLVTIGVLVTWLIGSLGAYFILHLDLPMALLLGAILVVTGPTVIIPLLRHLRPNAQLDAILKWEGVIIDPIGAILAVLVFQVILAGGFPEGPADLALNLLKTFLVSGSLSLAGAGLIIAAFRRYWVPDHLHNAFTLMLVVAVFAASNQLQQDSGLLTATVMGVILANQKQVNVRHIAEFKENLRVLIISSLFILLAARLKLADAEIIGWGSLLFLGVLVLIARPAAVWLSTWRSKLGWRERVFISGLAPRGVVAASVSSVFAIRMGELGYAQAELLVPITFVVIVGTVAIYGLFAPLLARGLKVAEPDPQGILIAGASLWARTMGQTLHREGFSVMLVENNWSNISQARMSGLPALYANMLSEYALEKLETDAMGYLLAITSDDEFNSLVITQFSNIFERSHRFQVAPEDENRHAKHTVSRYLRGRVLFNPELTSVRMNRALLEGGNIKVTRLSDEFSYADFQADQKSTTFPLFVITEKDKLLVFSADSTPSPQAGQKIVSLIMPVDSAEIKLDPAKDTNS